MGVASFCVLGGPRIIILGPPKTMMMMMMMMMRYRRLVYITLLSCNVR